MVKTRSTSQFEKRKSNKRKSTASTTLPMESPLLKRQELPTQHHSKPDVPVPLQTIHPLTLQLNMPNPTIEEHERQVKEPSFINSEPKSLEVLVVEEVSSSSTEFEEARVYDNA